LLLQLLLLLLVKDRLLLLHLVRELALSSVMHDPLDPEFTILEQRLARRTR
jgi:hypothetical protein